MNARRILVTGGNGFLGSSVIPRLAAADDVELVISADLRDPNARVEGVIYETADVVDPTRVDQLIGSHDISTVVHLASIVNPGKGMSDELAYAVDVDGTRNVLEACVTHGVGRIVVSSSGAAYGYHADSPDWITESQPVRGNDAFAYSKHKRLVEEMLATYRCEHPDLEQVVLRIGTILGRTVDNQITDLFRKKRLLKIVGAKSPFVFIWDEDLVAIVIQAVTGSVTGTFNVAGDGAMTIDEIASALGKSTLPIPERILRTALAIAKPLGLTQYGPEQTKFLQFRPVLLNTRLKAVFGYTPSHTSREAFEAWREAQGLSTSRSRHVRS